MRLSEKATHVFNSVTDAGVLSSFGNVALLFPNPVAMAVQAVRLALCLAARYVAEEKRAFKNELLHTIFNDPKNSFVVMSAFNIGSGATALLTHKLHESYLPAAVMLTSGAANLVTGASERIFKAINKTGQKEPWLIRDPSLLWIPAMAVAIGPAREYVWPFFAVSAAVSWWNNHKGLAPQRPWESPVVWQAATTLGATLYNVIHKDTPHGLWMACLCYGLSYLSYDALRLNGGVAQTLGMAAQPKCQKA